MTVCTLIDDPVCKVILGCELWNSLPEGFKRMKTLASSKKQIKKRKNDCNCRLCRKLISQLRFLT